MKPSSAICPKSIKPSFRRSTPGASWCKGIQEKAWCNFSAISSASPKRTALSPLCPLQGTSARQQPPLSAPCSDSWGLTPRALSGPLCGGRSCCGAAGYPNLCTPTVDKETFRCYSNIYKRIFPLSACGGGHSCRGRIANRVQIPNGTATVSVEVSLQRRKSVIGEKLRRLRGH